MVSERQVGFLSSFCAHPVSERMVQICGCDRRQADTDKPKKANVYGSEVGFRCRKTNRIYDQCLRCVGQVGGYMVQRPRNGSRRFSAGIQAVGAATFASGRMMVQFCISILRVLICRFPRCLRIVGCCSIAIRVRWVRTRRAITMIVGGCKLRFVLLFLFFFFLSFSFLLAVRL